MFQNGKKAITPKMLTFSAVSIALAIVLSFFTIYRMPQGGSVKLFSMFFVCLPGYFFGPVIGIISAMSYGLLDLVIDPYVTHPAQLLLDYILAYGVLGVSGFFYKMKYGLYVGYLAGVFGRFLFSTISGAVFFYMYAGDQNPWIYSIIYQAQYLVVEATITMAVIIIPVFRKGIDRVRLLALS